MLIHRGMSLPKAAACPRSPGPDEVPDEFPQRDQDPGPDDTRDPDFDSRRGGDSYDGPDGRYSFDPY